MRRTLPLKSYKYRIYPTDAQIVFFAKTFGNVQLQFEKAFRDHLKNRKQLNRPKFKKKKDKNVCLRY